MRSRTLKTVLTAAFCLTTLPAVAAPLQKSEVSPAANWVAHVDLEAFRSSEIGKLILAELRNQQDVQQKLQTFAVILSFDPLQDIREVTIYGNGKDRKKAVVIVEGQFDTQKLISLLQQNSQFQEIPYKGTTLYRWQQGQKQDGQSTGDPPAQQSAGEMMYGCVCEGNRIVIGTELQALQGAVDTLKGRTKVASTGLIDQIPQAQGKVFAQVVATGMAGIVGQDPQATMLKQMDSLALTVGESADQVFGQVSLRAQTPEVAQNTAKLLEGLVAMVQLSASEQLQLAELAKSLRIVSNDKTIQIRIDASTQTLFEVLKSQWEQNREQNRQPPSGPTP